MVSVTVGTPELAKELVQKFRALDYIPTITRDEGMEYDIITQEEKFVFRKQTLLVCEEFMPSQVAEMQKLIDLASEYDDHSIYKGKHWPWQQPPRPPT